MYRRRLLQFAAGGAAGTMWGTVDRPRSLAPDGSSLDAPAPAEDGFDPALHGYSFPNWAGDVGTAADGDEFAFEPGQLSREDVRGTIEEAWTAGLSEAATNLMTRIVYSWIGGGAATNGHCYGMIFSADEYFRDPSALPADADVTSEIPQPTGPYERVGDRIRRLQTSQLLRAEPFWFAFLGFRWGLGDQQESLRQLTTSIDETGTGGLILNGEADAHQVLAYEYERTDDGTVVGVYDPNHDAGDYQDGDPWTLVVDEETGEVIEIEEGFDEYLFHDPEMDRSVTERLIGGVDRVIDTLSDAVFLGLETGGSLALDVPGDVIVDRPAAEYADPERSPYADAAVVIGSLDEFEVEITGEPGNEYSLDTLALRGGELVLEEGVTGTLAEAPARLKLSLTEAGEMVVDAVEDVEEGASEAAEDQPEETVEQANNGMGWLGDYWWVGLAGSALGIGAAYRFLMERSDEEDDS